MWSERKILDAGSEDAQSHPGRAMSTVSFSEGSRAVLPLSRRVEATARDAGIVSEASPMETPRSSNVVAAFRRVVGVTHSANPPSGEARFLCRGHCPRSGGSARCGQWCDRYDSLRGQRLNQVAILQSGSPVPMRPVSCHAGVVRCKPLPIERDLWGKDRSTGALTKPRKSDELYAPSRPRRSMLSPPMAPFGVDSVWPCSPPS